MILMTGWKGETDFIDPMCGSGTLLIEAALIARNISPGVFRKEYAFEKWADFDKDLFDSIYNDDSQEREFEHHIYGYDIDMKSVNTARLNAKAAGLTNDITIEQQDFKDFTQPEQPAIIVTNPPYGERISTPNLLATYKMIGERLKNAFKGNTAWVLSYREECFDQIGLKPSIKIPVFNGSLECEFRKYQMFEGKFRDFRKEGNEIKTEEEKAAMAEKRRFKEHREFKKRIDEEAELDSGDIRSFTFKHHPAYEIAQQRRERIERERERERQARDRERERSRDSRGRRSGWDDDRRDGKRGGGFRRGDGDSRRGGGDRPFRGGDKSFRGGDRPFKGKGKRDFRDRGGRYDDED